MQWTSPLTKFGRSALVPEGPWSYAFDAIAVHAVANPDRLKNITELKTDGEMWIYFADIISHSPNFPQLNYETPQLVQYKEVAFFIKIEFEGKSYAYCPFMYVDNDVSLMRGYIVGFPKKIASIGITRDHPLMKQKIFGANAMRAGYSLIRAKVEVEEKAKSLPLDNFGTWILRRYIGLMGIDELIEFVPEVEYEYIYRGKATLEIGGGINDELEFFKPEKILEGYRYSALLKVKDIRVLKSEK
ncbi:hypothetical protein Asulf_00209 [Archaeoglobus sulfaticallidus PM70-1]|uniref:Acetoacetate decarboxylase n=1 Tax=Archaeoglobus sulfaticallidus PM70-1 TaxID=387631 RepID=N0BB65_9EURY|nr:acetoacetate decarboxylase family protein [Archaeoglobus sulfaticallidus]AGK60243.1 hypothetical protein Asulf_00209 [Archaeoglobus sulfaticallidus PM70-1]